MHLYNRRTAGNIHESSTLGVFDCVGSCVFILCDNPKLGGDPAVAKHALRVALNVGICTILSIRQLELG